MIDNADFYYTVPNDEVFNEVADKAKQLFSLIATNKDYLKEKVDFIDHCVSNKHFMVIINLFHPSAQFQLVRMLSKEAREEIRLRLEAGGLPDTMNIFAMNIFKNFWEEK